MLFDVGGHEGRVQLRERGLALLTPGTEPPHGAGIGQARVRVPDVGRKELQEPPGRLLAVVGDEGRQLRQATPRERAGGKGGQFAGHAGWAPG